MNATFGRLGAALVFGALLVFCATPNAQAGFAGQEKIVDPELAALAEGAGAKAMSTIAAPENVRVIVTLVEPAVPTDQGMKPLSTAYHPADEKALAVRSQQMSQTLLAVASPKIQVSQKLNLLGAFAAEVGPEELKRLAGNQQVAYIERDLKEELFTKQGLALMHAMSLHKPTAGQNLAIAVLDTGVNYNHEALGGGGFPNKKVIGGYDFAGVVDLSNPRNPRPRPDADPIDPPKQGHGTWCSGIAAGYMTTKRGDYVGGVAPGAKLYALKVFGDNWQYTYRSWRLPAYEWILKNQYKDPKNPIMIVSMSLGGSMREDSSWPKNGYCKSPSESKAMQKLNQAGITVFVASGNDARCQRISAPACLREAISVGAVSDVARNKLSGCVPKHTCIKNTFQHLQCSKYNRVAFQRPGGNKVGDVSYYSNSSQVLDILAPADWATCPGHKAPQDYMKTFAGTSAATPYAAGAGAVIQSAVKKKTGRFLKPDELRKVLIQTGQPVKDWRNGLVKPLVNLDKALAYAVQLAGGQPRITPPKAPPPPKPKPAPKLKPAPQPQPPPAPKSAPKPGSGEKDITNQLFGN